MFGALFLGEPLSGTKLIFLALIMIGVAGLRVMET
jgi:multidrug transporter EmrE-like cation transporter